MGKVAGAAGKTPHAARVCGVRGPARASPPGSPEPFRLGGAAPARRPIGCRAAAPASRGAAGFARCQRGSQRGAGEGPGQRRTLGSRKTKRSPRKGSAGASAHLDPHRVLQLRGAFLCAPALQASGAREGGSENAPLPGIGAPSAQANALEKGNSEVRQAGIWS